MGEHSLIHSNVKPFECDLCNNQFRTRQLIKRHQFLHHTLAFEIPNRRYKCSQCERSFDRKMRLENHIAIHLTNTTKQQTTKKEVVNEETQIEPKIEKYLDQWHEKREPEERGNQEVKETNIHNDDFELGEIYASNQTMVTEYPETGEIVDMDKETLVLFLQTRQEVEINTFA